MNCHDIRIFTYMQSLVKLNFEPYIRSFDSKKKNVMYKYLPASVKAQFPRIAILF